MNEAIVFDTHKFVRNLTASGFTERQAEALANEQVQLLNANLATKADIANVQADLEAKIANVQASLEARITNVQANLEVKIANVQADLEAKIANGQSNLLKWMFAALVAQSGIIVTFITLL